MVIEVVLVYASWRANGLTDTGIEVEFLQVFFKEKPIQGEYWLLWTVGLFVFFQLAHNISPKSPEPEPELPSIHIEITGTRLK